MGVDGVSFYEIADRDPDRPAVLGPGGPLSYGQLHGRVNRCSAVLRRLGLRPGDTVATVLGNRPEFLVALFAAMQNGLYFVPVSRHLTKPEIAYILTDSGAGAVITEDALAGTVQVAAGEAGVAPSALLSVDAPEWLGDASETPPDERRMGSIMFYTSGTTGRPKGVQRPLLDLPPEPVFDLLRQTVGRDLDFTPGDGVHLVLGPLYHSAPCAHAMVALIFGHAVVVPPRFEPESALRLVQDYRVTNTFMVPTMFHRLLGLPEDVRNRYDTSSLQQVFHSAAPVAVHTKQAMMDWLGPVLWEYYGSTESGAVVLARPEEWLAHPGTVGRPLDGVEVKILDEDGRELPAGETGMIYVRGGTLGFEYHDDPDKTAAAHHGDLYTPGDLGYLDEDGFVHMSDRRTDLIISGGVNLYPAEIEAALLRHPAVADVAVIGVPDEEWGQQPIALVEPAPGHEPDASLVADLLAHCEPLLARLKHPRRIEFRTKLPRTPSGKLSRSRLRESYLKG
ncbi:AMP-binding protein [Actinomadura rupiterrae]|uniref:AMP-binding protein n=1 Tax=Actinomadura rupiterrae TaxID=559627 RepID=UPI0020A38F18|nr:AMP-binding protein [Actinomadura rupiterrae]MCP2339507.1 long-chain acyl-CoA synthetase [Actinomadura rupiterrae]